jgi:hypothetical protein
MLSTNDIHTLPNMVITKLTQIHLVFRIVSSCEVVTMVVVQAKESFYHDRHPTNMFLLLANRGFWVLTPTSGQFFHQCASMVQLAKGIGDPPLAVLCAFYRQRIALQRTQGASILKHIIIESEGFSKLTMISGFPSFSFSNMVLATCGGF